MLENYSSHYDYEERDSIILKSKPKNTMVIAVFTCLAALISRIAYIPVLYATITFYKEYGYENLGQYALMLYMIGDSLANVFVGTIVKKIGTRIVMTIGTFLMMLQIASYLILIKYPLSSIDPN